jgi:surface protein
VFFGANAFDKKHIGKSKSKAVVTSSMEVMFNSAAAFNRDIGDWDTSAVINMNGTFADASNTSAVSSMYPMLYNAVEFNQDISGCCIILSCIFFKAEGDCDSTWPMK